MVTLQMTALSLSGRGSEVCCAFVAGIKLTLDDAGCAQQKLQVCFLAPGMYVMYATQIQTQLRQAEAPLVQASDSVAVNLIHGFFEVS